MVKNKRGKHIFALFPISILSLGNQMVGDSEFPSKERHRLKNEGGMRDSNHRLATPNK